jgi:opacity protein-like surface antigen
MTKLSVTLAAALVAVAGAAGPAAAQTPPRTQPPARRPLPRPKPRLSDKLFVRVEGLVGFEHFNASSTFKAIFDTANAPVYGGGIDVVKGRLFVRADVSHFGKTGERAIDVNGEVFRLGIPLKVSITPVIGAAGVRTILARNLVAYVGGGAGSWSFSQSGDDSDDNFSEQKVGYLGLGGVEWRVHRLVGIGFEAQYARVPNAFSGGIAADFNEKDLGGTTAAVRVIVGHW